MPCESCGRPAIDTFAIEDHHVGEGLWRLCQLVDAINGMVWIKSGCGVVSRRGSLEQCRTSDNPWRGVAIEVELKVPYGATISEARGTDRGARRKARTMTGSPVNFIERFGSDVSSRWRAAELRTEIERAIAGGDSPFTIDFTGVRTVSDSFADEVFAILVVEHGEEWFSRNIRVVNLSEGLRTSILGAVLDRLESQSRLP